MLPVKEMSANTAFCAFVPGCTKVEHTLVTLVNDDHVDFYSILRTAIWFHERSERHVR